MKKGLFITLEGNEGCGKTTQVRLLDAYLRRRGKRTYLTREPGGTRTSDGIREVLLDNRNKGMTPLCETLLYMASRAQLVETVLAPKLASGCAVLCDRWLDATVAYQGFGGGIDVQWIRSLGRQVTRGIRPDLTLFLDLPLEIGLRRAKSRRKADRMESKALAFHRRVRRGYEKIAKAEPRRFRRIKISAEDSVSAVHEKIKETVNRVL